jgi:hypothetical protein
MVREVRTLNWCDPCFAENVHEEGTTHTLSLSPKGGYAIIELCSRHEAELLLPLQEILSEHGRPAQADGEAAPPRAARGRKGEGTYTCPVPGCTFGPYSHPGGLRSHISQKHRRYQPVEPQVKSAPAPDPELQLETTTTSEESAPSFVCEVCGADFSDSPRASQALGGHLWRTHKVSAKASA